MISERLTGPVLASTLFLSGCAVAEAGSAPSESDKVCHTVELQSEGIGAAVRGALRDIGLNPVELDGVKNTISDINSELNDLHKKYSTPIPGDEFEICISGDNVSSGAIVTVIDK